MAKEMRSIDISGVPDMVRIAEEVRTSGRPRILRRNGEDMAMVIPIAHGHKSKSKRTRTKADYDAFLSAAGGWKGLVDADKLLADIYESRELSTKPPIEL
ncbi:MAG: hypothetical protein ACRDIV_07260 [Ktedonobacteraceae bacterium]